MFSRRVLSLIVLIATLSFGSALANECASAPMRSDDGTYNGCEVVHGAEVLFRDAEDVPEAACPKICEALSEIDALAAESHELDEKAGFGGLNE